MDVKYENVFGAEAKGQGIVYVRPVLVSSLPSDVQTKIGPIDTVYSVHRTDGEQLALVADRKLAFHLAREHHFAPVYVN